MGKLALAVLGVLLVLPVTAQADVAPAVGSANVNGTVLDTQATSDGYNVLRMRDVSNTVSILYLCRTVDMQVEHTVLFGATWGYRWHSYMGWCGDGRLITDITRRNGQGYGNSFYIGIKLASYIWNGDQILIYAEHGVGWGWWSRSLGGSFQFCQPRPAGCSPTGVAWVDATAYPQTGSDGKLNIRVNSWGAPG